MKFMEPKKEPVCWYVLDLPPGPQDAIVTQGLGWDFLLSKNVIHIQSSWWRLHPGARVYIDRSYVVACTWIVTPFITLRLGLSLASYKL